MLPLLHRHLPAIADGAVPAAVRDALSERAHADAQRNLRLTGELLRLLDLCATHGVAAVPYKGPVLAVRCYGDLALRPFRDLDLLVHRHDLARAQAVLAAEGYRPMHSLSQRQQAALWETTCESALTRGDDIVELHYAFGPAYFPLALEVADVFARLEPVWLGGRSVATLCNADLLLVLCAHGAKHQWERLEWICDVAELLRCTPALDLEAVLAQARGSGAERMTLLGLELAAELLGAPLSDTVRRRASADGAVAALAAQVRAQLFRHTPGKPVDSRRMRLFQWRVLERWQDRLRALARAACAPGPADWAWLPLPDPLYSLYYILRPIRLVVKYGLRKGPGRRGPAAAPMNPAG